MIFDNVGKQYDVVAVQEHGRVVVTKAKVFLERTTFSSESELESYIRENCPGKSFLVMESING